MKKKAPPIDGAIYTISDGKLVLFLEEAEEGGFGVTSPLWPELITQAETVREAFANAYDALTLIKECKRDLRPARKGQSRARARAS